MDNRQKINLIKFHLGYKTDEELANFLGISQPTISQWKSGTISINYSLIIEKTNNKFNFNWLHTGEGKPLNRTPKDRLLEFFETQGIKIEEFYEKTKFPKDFLSKSKFFSLKTYRKISEAFPELNEDWLAFEEGDMLQKIFTLKSAEQNFAYQNNYNINYNRMPSVISVSEKDEGRENIEFVPIKLAAGYVGGGYAEEYFIESLPKTRIPFLNNGTCRAFEVGGHSMNEIKDTDYFIGRFLENLQLFKEGGLYAIIAPKAKSFLVKRVFRNPENTNSLILRSDNNDVANTYPDIHIHMKYISEMWSHVGVFSFKEPDYNMEKFKTILSTNPKYVTIE